MAKGRGKADAHHQEPSIDLVEEVRRMAAERPPRHQVDRFWLQRREQKAQMIMSATREMLKLQAAADGLRRWIAGQRQEEFEREDWAECDDGQEAWKPMLGVAPGEPPTRF